MEPSTDCRAAGVARSYGLNASTHAGVTYAGSDMTDRALRYVEISARRGLTCRVRTDMDEKLVHRTVVRASLIATYVAVLWPVGWFASEGAIGPVAGIGLAVVGVGVAAIIWQAKVPRAGAIRLIGLAIAALICGYLVSMVISLAIFWLDGPPAAW